MARFSNRKKHDALPITRPRYVFEGLEPRLLLSADPFSAAVADSESLNPFHNNDPSEDEALAAFAVLIRTDADSPLASPETPVPLDLDSLAELYNSDDAEAVSPVSEDSDEVTRELIIIDAATPDYQQLLNDLTESDDSRSFDIVILQGDENGIAQIGAALNRYTDLDAVHIISHGTDAAVQLGDTRLDSASLATYADAISGWGEALTAEADLLFYGCDLAATADGRLLVESIAGLTGADIAASDDFTGHADLGGGLDVAAALDREEPLAAGVFDELADDSRINGLHNQLNPLAGAIGHGIENDGTEPLDLTRLGGLLGGTLNTVTENATDTHSTIAEQESAATRTELVFIDAGVEDHDQLLADLGLQADDARQIDIHWLDAQSDGVEQIAQVLAGYQDVDAFHILSHGAAGRVQLGSGTLSTGTLDGYAGHLNDWGSAIADDGDILIYGCDLAADEQGRALVDAIGVMTGADVAASVDQTGHAASGGDWDLEYWAGMVDVTGFSPGAFQVWQGTLGSITVTTTADDLDGDADTGSLAALALNPGSDGEISLREAIKAAETDIGLDTILLQTGTYTMSSFGFDDNTGDFDIRDDLSIVGVSPGASVIDGADFYRIFEVHGDAAINVSFQDLTLLDGSTGAGGPDGGALMINDGSFTPTVTVSNVWFSSNEANGGGAGGAIFNEGNLTITNSLIEGNTATNGGGIANAGGTLTLTNVTVSGNTAINAGGGLYNQAGATITNSTFTLNDANDGGGIRVQSGTVSIANTISAGNTGTSGHNDVLGTFNSLGYNLIGDRTGSASFTDGVNGDQVGTNASPLDPMLDPLLGDNGGPTKTHALLGGSTAIDAADQADMPTTDARGFLRGDGSPDIGAYEASASASSTATYLDQFNSIAYDGDDGALPWSTDWQEVGVTEPSGPSTESIKVVSDQGGALHFGGSNLEVGDYIWREADLSGAATATLSFDYKRQDGKAQTAAVDLEIRSDASSPWEFLANFDQEPYTYTQYSVDISAYASATTQIRFITTIRDTDYLNFDNVQIELSTSSGGNTPPSLTAFSGVVDTTNEDTEVELSFADLAAQGDESDADGTVDAFVVKSVSSGTLKIGTSAGTATAWSLGGNDTIDATNKAYWTPDAHANGTLDAFAVVAQDDDLAESTGDVTLQVEVNAANDAPTISNTTFNFGSTDEDTVSTGVQVSTIVGGLSAGDPDGDAVGMAVIGAFGNGTWQYSTDSTDGSDGNWTGFGSVAGNSALLLSDTSWVRYQPDGMNGENVSINFHAWDGTDGSASTTGTPSTSDPDGGGGIKAYSLATPDADLTVSSLNDAPVLGAIGGQSVGEGATLTFTATASDSDDPADNLTYTLDATSIALGMSIDPNTGVFSWTPTEGQGGLTPSVTITVTDSGTGNLTDAETFTITVNDTNTAPVLGAIGDQSVDEGATLSFTATATDSDLPADTLTFSLDAASIAAGMSITAGGDFSWTPTESQGGSTPSVTITVTDDGTGSLVDSETFTITVNDTNTAPVLGAIGDQSIDEGVTLSLTATATDSDLPTDALTFSLDAASIALGMSIDANSGAFSWTPTEGQGGLTPSVTITVTDDGTGNLTDAETFTITVNDVNVAPVLGAIGDQNVVEGSTLTFTATATDADLPADNLSFSLDAASLALGMTIDVNTGAFSWTPTETQGGLTPSVTITVTDNGTGNLFDSETFTITVNDLNTAPVLAAIGNQSVDEGATLSFTATATDADLPADTLSFSLDAASLALGMTIDANTGTFSWTPTEGQGGLTPSVTVTVTDDGTGNLIDSETFTITVNGTNTAPVITSDGSGATAFLNAAENQTGVTTVTSTDADLPVDTLTYTKIGGADQALFDLNPGTGVLTFASTPDFETFADTNLDGVYEVEVQVSDGLATDTQLISVTVTDGNEVPIAVTLGNLTVAGNSDGAIVSHLTTTDPDSGDSHTYTVDDARFEVVAGQLKLKAGETLDFASEPSISLNVTSTDAGGLSVSQGLTLTVANPATANTASNVDTTPLVVPQFDPPAAEITSESLSTHNETPLYPATSLEPDAADVSDAPDEATENETETNTPDTDAGPEVPLASLDLGDGAGVLADDVQVQGDKGKTLNATERKVLVRQLIEIFSREGDLDKDFSALFQEAGFLDGLNRLRDDVAEDAFVERTLIGSSVAAATGLSVGYVVWLLRSGMLLSSVLSSMPAWRLVDPLPVLAYLSDNGDDDKDDDTLASLIAEHSKQAGPAQDRQDKE